MPEDVDPALHNAAEAIEPELREHFPDTYAGLVIAAEQEAHAKASFG
jgi:hypothetical protein